eukprot:11869049-Ditylum_brightwellii.AAC.1
MENNPQDNGRPDESEHAPDWAYEDNWESNQLLLEKKQLAQTNKSRRPTGQGDQSVTELGGQEAPAYQLNRNPNTPQSN